jgi:hypothetical protein
MYQRIQRARDSEKRARTREHVFDEAIWRLGGWNERKESQKQGIALLKRAMKMGHPGKAEKEKKKVFLNFFFPPSDLLSKTRNAWCRWPSRLNWC